MNAMEETAKAFLIWLLASWRQGLILWDIMLKVRL